MYHVTDVRVSNVDRRVTAVNRWGAPVKTARDGGHPYNHTRATKLLQDCDRLLCAERVVCAEDTRMSDDDRSGQRESEAGTDPRHDENDSATTGHESARHPCPWATIDYSAARPSDPEWQDRGTPPGIPEPMSGQTTFNPDDASPSERDHYRWLAKKNQGVGDSSRRRDRQRAGLERDLGVVVSQLNATDRQKERAEWLLDRIDIKDEILTCGPIELAVVAVVSLAIDEDRTRFAHHENAKAKSVLRDMAFNRLCDEFDLEKREVRRVRQRVRETDVYKSPNS